MSENTLNPNEIDRLLESRPRRRRGLVIAAFLGCAGLAAVMLARPERSGDREYETVAVERRDLVATVTATGQLEPTDQVDVGSEISGIVAGVLVETNDRVAKGQILAMIDTSRLEQQTERSRAALISAEAALGESLATQSEAEAKLARFEEVHRLSDGRVPSQSELDAARAAKLRADAGGLDEWSVCAAYRGIYGQWLEPRPEPIPAARRGAEQDLARARGRYARRGGTQRGLRDRPLRQVAPR